MFVVDTNILLYAADLDSPDHEPCRGLLEEWRRGSTPWYLTWGVVYEFLRVATHPNVFRTPFSLAEAWGFLDVLLASPSLFVLKETERHSQIVTEVFKEIPDIRSRHNVWRHSSTTLQLASDKRSSPVRSMSISLAFVPSQTRA